MHRGKGSLIIQGGCGRIESLVILEVMEAAVRSSLL